MNCSGPIAAGDLSDFSGCQGRPGGKRGHGGSGDAVRNFQPAQHLVSDQSSGRRFLSWAESTTAQIAAFQSGPPAHRQCRPPVTSLLVGLLYGAMLPMLPRRPILLGGFIAPLLWSGLIHSILEFVNPVLNQRIDWLWFVASQVGFGIVAGIVVSRQERIRTWQHLPFAVRAGFEALRTMGRGTEKTRR